LQLFQKLSVETRRIIVYNNIVKERIGPMILLFVLVSAEKIATNKDDSEEISNK
jgi:hypothetical protein